MSRRPTGEGIGDGDLAVSVAVEEIFAANTSSAESASSPNSAAAARTSALLGRPRLAKRRRIQK